MRKKLEEQIWAVYNKGFRAIINQSEYFNILIKLLFLRYITTYPDKLNLTSIESYNKISELKRKLELVKSGVPLITSDIRDILNIIDMQIYRLDNFTEGLEFIFDGTKRYDRSAAEYTLNAVDNIEIKDDKEYMISLFEIAITMSSNRLYPNSSTSISLRKLVCRLLEIQPVSKVLNAYGGYSTLTFNLNDHILYDAYETHPTTALVSKLMQIMLGNKTSTIYNEDYLYSTSDVKYDYIFSDFINGGINKLKFPFAYKGIETNNRDIANILKITSQLSDNGKAAILVPGVLLFGSGSTNKELRKEIVSNNLLRAVIELPQIVTGVGTRLYLLIIDKNNKENVTFVDASGFGTKYREGILITSENIEKISSIIENKIVEPEVSQVMSNKDVLEGDSLLPNKYIETNFNESVRTVKEIDKELTKLYSDLSNLL